MKKSKLMVLALAAMMALALIGCGSKTGMFGDKDFRNASWGENQDTVKAAETEEIFLEQPVIIHYKGSWEGYDDVVISYNFNDDKLYQAGFMINSDDIEADFAKVQGLIEDNYGKATKTIGNSTIYEIEKTIVELDKGSTRIDVIFRDANFGK